MEVDDQPVAGPSKPPSRKPRAPHPSGRLDQKVVKRPPPLPKPPTLPSRPGGTTSTHPHLPIKVLQGVGARRTDTTKPGSGREVIFVTRKTSLGSLIGRAKSLIVNEGYTHLIIHALGAAIPHACLLLHALLDALPYPRGPRGLWYEIKTGSVDCIDEVTPVGGPGTVGVKDGAVKGKPKKRKRTAIDAPGLIDKGAAGAGVGDGRETVVADTSDIQPPPKGKQTGAEENKEDDEINGSTARVKSWLAGIGSIEEEEPERSTRTKSSINIDIYIGPKPSLDTEPAKKQKPISKPGEGRARPNKKRRLMLAAQRQKGGTGQGDTTKGGSRDKALVTEGEDEEDAMNEAEEEEEVEMVETR